MRNFGAAYDVVLFLHILTVVVGFGGVLLNGLYGAQAKKAMGAEGRAIAGANSHVSETAMYFIYAVFPLGLGLVFMSDDTWGMGQMWISASMGLYIVALGISHGVQRPAVKKMLSLMDELAAGPPPGGGSGGPPPQVAQLEALGKKLGAMGGVLSLLFVVILYLMIAKPGL